MTFLFALGVLVLEVQKLRKMSLPSEGFISRMDTFHDGVSSSLVSLEERADNLSLEIFKIADDINNRFAPASGGEN